jgi:glutamate dehydrogenase/leucine dehydrogenase
MAWMAEIHLCQLNHQNVQNQHVVTGKPVRFRGPSAAPLYRIRGAFTVIKLLYQSSGRAINRKEIYIVQGFEM